MPGDAVLGSVVESPIAVSCVTKEVLQELIVQWRLLGHDEAVSREMRLSTNGAHAGSNDGDDGSGSDNNDGNDLSLIHISEPTRLLSISYAVFCLKKKNKHTK
eukprot:TRINITY_DN23348_c0_g1_i2.p1 TRINITY_DN23348_c0_g1~~TRINITY_DN23348_c0_g1_i2.p1  ORF type:complete len:103 (-),score=24.08 TRINITY_DN23348_c0_g1_i2:38-346(-)